MGDEAYEESLNGVAPYPVVWSDKYGELRHKRPVDLGVADYLAKELNKPCRGTHHVVGAKVYVTQAARLRAAKMHSEGFRLKRA